MYVIKKKKEGVNKGKDKEKKQETLWTKVYL